MNHSNEIQPPGRSDPREIFRTAREREEEIERSAAYTGRLIREADSEARFELTEAASAILRQEALGETSPASTDGGPTADARIRSVNPLSAGIGIVVLGAGISLLLPMVGIAMMVIGAIALLWGLALSIRER